MERRVLNNGVKKLSNISQRTTTFNRRAILIAVSVFLVMDPIQLSAHGGGLDKFGCHAGSQPRHCHNNNGSEELLRQKSSANFQSDLDCKDFGSWREAQAFYESFWPNDPHGLDRDRDGIACEHLAN